MSVPSTIGSLTNTCSTGANNSVSLTRKAEPVTSHSHTPRNNAHHTIVDKINDSFTCVRNRNQCKRNMVVGTKKSELFQDSRSKVNLFVSQVPTEYPEQHIRDKLSDAGVEILIIAKLSHQMQSCLHTK